MIGDPGDFGSIDAIPVPGGEDEKVEGEVIPRGLIARGRLRTT